MIDSGLDPKFLEAAKALDALTPAALVRVAIEDMKREEKNPNVVLRPDVWLSRSPDQAGVCMMCLAGSVLYRLAKETRSLDSVLNIRAGSILSAMGIRWVTVLDNILHGEFDIVFGMYGIYPDLLVGLEGDLECLSETARPCFDLDMPPMGYFESVAQIFDEIWGRIGNA